MPKSTVSKPILIVEDCLATIKILKKVICEHLDVEIHVANDYAQAKEKLKRFRNDYLVAVCDLGLPDAPNGEILDLVDRAGVRIIALTGVMKHTMREQIEKSQLIDYVLKDSPNAYDYVANLIGRLEKNATIKALIADDSQSSLLILEEALSLLNFNVFKAENGKQALQILKENKDVRLLITDHEMPEMNGFELSIEARTMLDKDELAIIGISSSDHRDLGSNFIKNGANDFLYKPFIFEELLCRINMNMEALEHLDHIHELADKDFLTKLYNRRYFFEKGSQLFNQAVAKNHNFLIAMMDLDFFKRINDQYGHDVGDQALKHFSNLLQQSFADELVARIGGEEFILLFDGNDVAQNERKLKQFLTLVEASPLALTSGEINFTVSIGASIVISDDFNQTLKNADKNLYQAKEQGRNQLVANLD